MPRRGEIGAEAEGAIVAVEEAAELGSGELLLTKTVANHAASRPYINSIAGARNHELKRALPILAVLLVLSTEVTVCGSSWLIQRRRRSFTSSSHQ